MGDSIKPGSGSSAPAKSADATGATGATGAAASSSSAPAKSADTTGATGSGSGDATGATGATGAAASSSSAPASGQVVKGAQRKPLAINSQPDEANPPVVQTVDSVQELEPSRANVGAQKLDAAKAYRITKGNSITSPRGMLNEGDPVTVKDFGGSQGRIDELVDAKVHRDLRSPVNLRQQAAADLLTIT
jgi:hypothetical protein